jgi:hypothetical protein
MHLQLLPGFAVCVKQPGIIVPAALVQATKHKHSLVVNLHSSTAPAQCATNMLANPNHAVC